MRLSILVGLCTLLAALLASSGVVLVEWIYDRSRPLAHVDGRRAFPTIVPTLNAPPQEKDVCLPLTRDGEGRWALHPHVKLDACSDDSQCGSNCDVFPAGAHDGWTTRCTNLDRDRVPDHFVGDDVVLPPSRNVCLPEFRTCLPAGGEAVSCRTDLDCAQCADDQQLECVTVSQDAGSCDCRVAAPRRTCDENNACSGEHETCVGGVCKTCRCSGDPALLCDPTDGSQACLLDPGARTALVVGDGTESTVDVEVGKSYCLPSVRSCDSRFGTATWTEDEGWTCRCKYPNLFGGPGCNELLACGGAQELEPWSAHLQGLVLNRPFPKNSGNAAAGPVPWMAPSHTIADSPDDARFRHMYWTEADGRTPYAQTVCAGDPATAGKGCRSDDDCRLSDANRLAKHQLVRDSQDGARAVVTRVRTDGTFDLRTPQGVVRKKVARDRLTRLFGPGDRVQTKDAVATTRRGTVARTNVDGTLQVRWDGTGTVQTRGPDEVVAIEGYCSDEIRPVPIDPEAYHCVSRQNPSQLEIVNVDATYGADDLVCHRNTVCRCDGARLHSHQTFTQNADDPMTCDLDPCWARVGAGRTADDEAGVPWETACLRPDATGYCLHAPNQTCETGADCRGRNPGNHCSLGTCSDADTPCDADGDCPGPGAVCVAADEKLCRGTNSKCTESSVSCDCAPHLPPRIPCVCVTDETALERAKNCPTGFVWEGSVAPRHACACNGRGSSLWHWGGAVKAPTTETEPACVPDPEDPTRHVCSNRRDVACDPDGDNTCDWSMSDNWRYVGSCDDRRLGSRLVVGAEATATTCPVRHHHDPTHCTGDGAPCCPDGADCAADASLCAPSICGPATNRSPATTRMLPGLATDGTTPTCAPDPCSGVFSDPSFNETSGNGGHTGVFQPDVGICACDVGGSALPVSFRWAGQTQRCDFAENPACSVCHDACDPADEICRNGVDSRPGVTGSVACCVSEDPRTCRVETVPLSGTDK